MRKDCGDAAEAVQKDYWSSADIMRNMGGPSADVTSKCTPGPPYERYSCAISRSRKCIAQSGDRATVVRNLEIPRNIYKQISADTNNRSDIFIPGASWLVRTTEIVL